MMSNTTESLTTIDEHFTNYNYSLYTNETFERSSNLCYEFHKNLVSDYSDRYEYCNASFDTLLCWPPTIVNITVTQKCNFTYNKIKYDDTSKFNFIFNLR